jgi:hypothetical protein
MLIASLTDRTEAHTLAMEATIIPTFRGMLSRHRPDLSRDEVKQATKKCAETMEYFRKLDHTYYTKLTAAHGVNPLAFTKANVSEILPAESSTPTGPPPSAFIVDLAMLICVPNGLPVSKNIPGAKVYTPAQRTQLIDVAYDLLSRLEVNMKPDSPVFKQSMNDLRTLLTQRLSSILLRKRLGEYRTMFPAPTSDCFLATLPLLKEIDVQPSILKLGKFSYERIPANHDRYISEAHLERWSIAWTHQNDIEDRKLAEQLDLTPLDGRLENFTQRVHQILDLHLRVYRDIYLGSGIPSLFEKKQAEGRRKLANIVNAALTETSPLTEEDLPTEMAKPTKPIKPPPPNCNIQ